MFISNLTQFEIKKPPRTPRTTFSRSTARRRPLTKTTSSLGQYEAGKSVGKVDQIEYC